MRVLLVLFMVLITSHAYAADLNSDFSEFPHWRDLLAREQFVPPSHVFKGDVKPLLDAIFMKWKHLHYVTATENYGTEDHWATREETLKKDSYDCKGFDIAAYYDLLEAGVDESRMLIHVVYIKSTGEIHSVLVVDDWFLDNRAGQVMPATVLTDYYIPIFELNRQGWRQ